MGYLLDGKIIRDKRSVLLGKRVASYVTKPKLVIIQVGDNVESATYIRQKKLFGEKIGVIVEHIQIPGMSDGKEIIKTIQEFNSDRNVHGIIVQLPLPKGLDSSEIISAISPLKDVDGLTPTNIALLLGNSKGGYIPATTRGILTLMSEYNITLAGKRVVVVGRSLLVGKPTAIVMMSQDATVTVCHSKTVNLASHTREADVLIVATGTPGLISKDHVSPGQIVVDVGINSVEGSSIEGQTAKNILIGDVDAASVLPVVSALSPVPGGVGPLTVLSLFENLLEAYDRQVHL